MYKPQLPLKTLSAAALAGSLLASPLPLLASDHIDSPAIAQDRGADIADFWAFLDPNDNSQLVLILSTQGFIVEGEHFGMAIFDNNIRYRFAIENTGDAQPDLFIDVNYSKGLGRETPQFATITLPGGRTFTASTTIATQEYTPPPIVVTVDPQTGAKFYGGLTEDPFFLDDTGANRFVASSLANPGNPNRSLLGERGGRDTYAGFNTLVTCVSVPVALVRGNANVIGICTETQRREIQRVTTNGKVNGRVGEYVTVDREGLPLVNNGLIPAPLKNRYNGSNPMADARGDFRDAIVQSLRNLGTDDAHINTLLGMIQRNGDILRLDLRVPNRGPQGGNNPDGGFGNLGGRRLVDDVVDATFTLINNGVPLSDFVNANERRFRDTFPFVGDPYQPFPPGSGADDGTRQ